jgi:hypothetical protein
MKSGKQIKVNDNKNYSIIYGCVDNKNPKSIYINISAWAEPLSDYEGDYNKIIKNINKKIRQTVYNFLSKNNTNVPFLKDKTIVDLDLRESGIKFGKRSFMCCEITLFQNEEISINEEPVKKALNLVSTMVIQEIFDKDLDFKFNKKKQ